MKKSVFVVSLAFALGVVCSPAEASPVVGNVRYRMDLSKGLQEFEFRNYRDLMGFSIQTDCGRRYLSCKRNTEKSPEESDTAWNFVSPMFDVTPDAAFSVWVTVRGKADGFRTGQGNSYSPAVLWYDRDGQPLLAQDELGRDSHVRYPLSVSDPTGEFVCRPCVPGVVPHNAAKARISIGTSWPDFVPAMSYDVASVVFSERGDGDGDAWRKEVVEATDIRYTVGKEDFSRFRGEPSRRGVVEFRDDGMALVDGRPFFVIGPCSLYKCRLNGYSYEKGLRDLKAIGCNVAHTHIYEGEGPDFDELLDAAEKTGMMLTLEAVRSKLYLGPDRSEARWRQVARSVGKTRNRGVVFAWQVGDDTAVTTTPEMMLRDTMVCHEADRSAKTLSFDSLHWPNRHFPYSHACDAVGPELYPFRKAEPERDAFDRLVGCMDNAYADNRRAGAENKGYYAIVQAFSGFGGRYLRFPTPKEVRTQTYAAIAARARGVFFYVYCSKHEDERPDEVGVATTLGRFADFAVLTRELASLHDDLSSRDDRTQPGIAIVRGPALAKSGRCSVVALRKETGLLVASNVATEGVRAEFDVGRDCTSAEVLGENRSVPVRNGILADDFLWADSHVYRLK